LKHLFNGKCCLLTNVLEVGGLGGKAGYRGELVVMNDEL